jgi:hypothetical protein
MRLWSPLLPFARAYAARSRPAGWSSGHGFSVVPRADTTECTSVYGRRNQFRRNPPLYRGNVEEMPLAGHALELVSAAVFELKPGPDHEVAQRAGHQHLVRSPARTSMPSACTASKDRPHVQFGKDRQHEGEGPRAGRQAFGSGPRCPDLLVPRHVRVCQMVALSAAPHADERGVSFVSNEWGATRICVTVEHDQRREPLRDSRGRRAPR